MLIECRDNQETWDVECDGKTLGTHTIANVLAQYAHKLELKK